VSLGAWVRLSDAGLGCPDWPGCYGQLVGVPDEAHEIHAAEHRFGKPVEAPKAWKEMIHRYAAGRWAWHRRPWPCWPGASAPGAARGWRCCCWRS
jgi:heme A synthase